MGENIALISVGSVAGLVVTTVTSTPGWLQLLLALGTGMFLYLGKELGIQFVRYIKRKLNR